MRRATADEDEEDLLRLQAELLSQQGRPAATFRHIGKGKGAPAEPAAAEQAVSEQADDQGEADEAATELPDEDSWIVGGVVERPVLAASAPVLPSRPAAFPAATHRKLSKFALGRKKLASTGNGVERQHQAAEKEPQAATGPEKQQQHAQHAGNKSIGAAAAAADAAQRHAEPSSAAGGALTEAERTRAEIDAANQRMLAEMDPQQVAEARQELEERLGADKVAFLRSRGCSRLGSTPSGAIGANGTLPALPAQAALPDVTGLEAPAPRAVVSRPPISMSAAAAGQPGSGAGGHAAETGAGDAAVQRLRFSLEGRPVGLAPASEGEAGPTSVVQRDPLRQDEGTHAEGYTIYEACQLARSSLPAQRVVACRLLAAVLCASRLPACALWPDGRVEPRAIDLPLPSWAMGGAAGLDWGDVWAHALAADVTITLRLALDDSAAAVVTAAAHALARLVGAADNALGTIHAASPELPRVPVRYLHRPHPVGAWSAHALERAPPAAADAGPQQHPQQGEDEDVPDERQVARVDPLCGLLQMQVLDRAAYLLASNKAPAAVEPLLALLSSVAAAGTDAARAILDTPGLVGSVIAIVEGSGHVHAPDTAASKLRALALLRALSQAGSGMAQQLVSAGLGSLVMRFALAGAAAEPAQGAQAQVNNLMLQVEALRIWSACCAYGIFILPLDDAYPALAAHLGCPAWVTACTDAPAPPRLALMVEAHRAAAEAVVCSSNSEDASFLSLDCAASLARAALSWLQPLAVTGLTRLCHGVRASHTPLPAQAAFSALAAALRLLWAAMHHPGLDCGSIAEEVAAALRTVLVSEAGKEGTYLSGLARSLTAALAATSCEQEDLAIAASNALTSLLRLASSLELHPSPADLVPLYAQVTEAAVSAAEATELPPQSAARLEAQQHMLGALLEALPLNQATTTAGGVPPWANNSGKQLQGAGLEVRALLGAPVLAPPGAEDLALRALGALLSPTRALRTLCQAAAGALQEELQPAQGFLQAASFMGAWWQLADGQAGPAADLRCTALQLPTAEEMGGALLRAYAAHWLGLVPEQATAAEGTSPAAAARLRSLMRQPLGSQLPLPQDWMFQPGLVIGGHEPASTSTLAAIPEETTEPDEAPEHDVIGMTGHCLAFLLGLSAAHPALLQHIPLGLRLKGVLDLVFGTHAAPHRGSASEQPRPWLDPAVRRSAAVLLQILAAKLPHATEGDLRGIGAADAAGWARRFAEGSYGDALLACALALMLRPTMPEGVQVAVLSVLGEEGALHLLPPLRNAPGGTDAYLGRGKPPQAVLKEFQELEMLEALGRADEADCMIHVLHVFYNRRGWL